MMMNKYGLSLLLLLGVCLTPANPWAKGTGKSVSLAVGKAETLTLPSDMADVLVADPSIVNVGALKSNQLYLIGLKNGATNILVFDKNGQQIMDYNLQVSVDHSTLQGTLSSLLPGQNIKVSSVNDDIVLTGDVDNPMTASRANDIAGRFTGKGEGVVNLMRVKAEQQVTLKVKIVEASKAKLKELGVEAGADIGGDAGDFAGSGFRTAVASGLSRTPLGVGSVLFDAGGLGQLNVILRALEKDDLLNTLAEPNLTAISGEQAGFLVGGEFPIPSGRDQYGNILIDYKKYGVSLNFKPVVMSEDRISLQLNTEVSAPDSANSVLLTGVNVPAISVRRAETTVELNSGGSLMMAGLLQSQTIAGMSQLPGAKNAPVLGDLLKSQSFNRDETELLVLVTAYLVKPYADKEEAKRAEPAPEQEVSVSRALDTDLKTKLQRRFGTRYDRALTAAPEGASYALD